MRQIKEHLHELMLHIRYNQLCYETTVMTRFHYHLPLLALDKLFSTKQNNQ